MKKIFNQRYYKLFFIVTIFVNTLNLQVFGIEQNPLIPFALVWGVGLVVVQLVKGEIAWKRYALPLLFGYLLFLGIGTLTNSVHTAASWSMLALQGLIFFLLFANAKSTTPHALKTEMRQLNALVCGLMFAASVASIALFLGNVSYTANGATLGLVGNRLFGVYFNSNPASFLAIMTILFSLMALWNQTRFKAFYLLNIAVQGIYILLSNCRSALLILLVIILVFTYYFVFRRKQYHWARQLAIAFAISVGFFYGSSILKELLFLIPKAQGAIFEDGGRFQVETLVEIARLVRSGVWTNKYEIIALANEVSSGRIELYLNAYHAWRMNPLFGIGIGTFTETVRLLNPGSSVMAFDILHAHNLFLESLVTAGLAGFAIFGAFVLKSAMVMWESFRKYEYDRNYVIILLMSLVIFVDFAGSMMDYGVFYVYTISSVLFWIYLGYLFFAYHEQKEQWLRLSRDYELVDVQLKTMHYHNEHHANVQRASITAKKWHPDQKVLDVLVLLDYGENGTAKMECAATFVGKTGQPTPKHLALMQEAILQRMEPQLRLYGYTRSVKDIERIGWQD